MPFYTPLRYPGGKRRLAPAITELIETNRLKNIEYAEPYAGGAAVALALLFNEVAATIHINDLSRPVFAFWDFVLNDTKDLCRRVRSTRVSMAEWKRQRAVLEDSESADARDLGFAALFLNRTNRSGILSGGVIGGLKQAGQWSLDARFTKAELIARIARIGRYSNRIRLYQMDALAFTKTVVAKLGNRGFAFYDPPYVEKSEQLYLNNYDLRGHRAIEAGVLRLTLPWVVTYDRAAVDQKLYRNCRRLAYGLSYSAHERYQGREVMFMSDNLVLPRHWQKRGPVRLSPPKSQYPFFGKLENRN